MKVFFLVVIDGGGDYHPATLVLGSGLLSRASLQRGVSGDVFEAEETGWVPEE